MIFKGTKLALLNVLETYNLIFVTIRNLRFEYRIKKDA